MSTVAIVRTTPQTVVEDYARLLDLIQYQQVLDQKRTTILKNNISWHLLYPSANTTPWQVEGVAKKMRADGFDDLVVFEIGVRDQRVGFTRRLFGHQADAETLAESDDKVVDV